MKNKAINASAYDGFENIRSFRGRLESYRKSKLKSAQGHVEFIKKSFSSPRISVLELGSGNSKTLYALEKAGMLESGYGIEISRSRHEFARLWRRDHQFKKVTNINADVLQLNLKQFQGIDLCFCADLAFQFFEPSRAGSGLSLLRQLRECLKPGGKIVLELDGVDRIMSKIEGGNVKLWEEFASPDPWQFSLWDCHFEQSNRFLTWHKCFVKRNGSGLSRTSMVLRIYNQAEIRALFRQAGFTIIQFFAGWDRARFRNDKSEFIVVGTKSHG